MGGSDPIVVSRTEGYTGILIEDLINQGADVLTNHSGSPAVAQTAEEMGVKLVAYQSDMSRHAPHAQLTAITHQWGGYYTKVAQAVLAGTWKPQPVWGGMKDGFITLAPFGAGVPQDVAALIESKRRAIVAGSLKPFGKMTDDEIAKMNAFVEGVVGSLPGR